MDEREFRCPYCVSDDVLVKVGVRDGGREWYLSCRCRRCAGNWSEPVSYQSYEAMTASDEGDTDG